MIPLLRRYWARITGILVIIIVILFYIFSPRQKKALIMDKLFFYSQIIYQPVVRGITTTQNYISHESNFFLRQRVLNDEVVNLQKENAELRKQITEYREQMQELSRLHRLLELKQKLPFQTVSAEVIAVAPSNYYLTLILDKGSKDGLGKNMVVVNEDGLVGRILQVSAYASKVLLLGDQRSAVAVLIERTQSRAILEGTGAGECKLVMEDPQAKVQEGDRILTSGLGGIFPKGLWVGTIAHIDRDKRSGWATAIRVKPAADNYNIQESFVIVHPVEPIVDTKSLEEK